MNWKFLRKIVGAVLILLGLLALMTPLTPGGWLVFVGAELLGIEMLSPHKIKETYARLRSLFMRANKEGNESQEG